MYQGDEEKEGLIVDAGDLTPEHFVLLTSNLTLWVSNGFVIKTDETQEVISWSEECKIVLIDTPDGGLKDLLRIKNVFGLNITANELLKESKNLPYILIEEFPYGKALK